MSTQSTRPQNNAGELAKERLEATFTRRQMLAYSAIGLAGAALTAMTATPVRIAQAATTAASGTLPISSNVTNTMPQRKFRFLSFISLASSNDEDSPGNRAVVDLHTKIPSNLEGRVFQLRFDSKAAAVPGATPEQAAKLKTVTPEETASEQSLWMFQAGEDGWYVLRHWQNPLYVFDAFNAPSEPGSFADSHPYNGSSAQLFKIVELNGDLALLNKNGLYVSVSGEGFTFANSTRASALTLAEIDIDYWENSPSAIRNANHDPNIDSLPTYVTIDCDNDYVELLLGDTNGSNWPIMWIDWPIWSATNGQDDLVWYSSSQGYRGNGSWTRNGIGGFTWGLGLRGISQKHGGFDTPWYVDCYTQVRFADGSVPSDPPNGMNFASSAELYPRIYIRYDAAEGEDAPTKQTKWCGYQTSFSDKKPSLLGHVFTGWSRDSDGYEVHYLPSQTIGGQDLNNLGNLYAQIGHDRYYPGTSYEIEKTNNGQNLDLTAVYAPINYILSFDSNGGEGSMPSRRYPYGFSFNLPDCTFTREGYYCIGWAEDPESEEAEYKNNHAFMNWFSSEHDSLTLYAVWKPEIIYPAPPRKSAKVTS